MVKSNVWREARLRRHARVRCNVSGTSAVPRLSVFRSTENIYVQVIDDIAGRTLISASTLDADLRANIKEMNKTEAAGAVGKLIASRALASGVNQVVFDRGGYRYHGRVKALAQAAREGGIKF